MPRPHEDAQVLRDRVLIGKIDTHKFTRRYKYDKDYNAKDKVKP